MNNVAIVVSSCDAFFDAWRPFAFLFRKSWPDCSWPAYLLTNEFQIRSRSLSGLSLGPDRGWASNMKLALEQIDASYILYLQEDYFLSAPVRSEQLAADFAYAFENDVDALYFRARSKVESGFQSLNDRFGVVPTDSDGRTRCQLALWKRSSLVSVLREGENAWEMESRGSARTGHMKILSYRAREITPVPYLMSAIVRGLWTREAIEMCERNSVAITPHFRGTYSSNRWLRRWRRGRTRSHLRAELAARRGQIIDLD